MSFVLYMFALLKICVTNTTSRSFAQTVAAVRGQTKTRLPFHCGSDSSSTSSDGGTRMTGRRGSSYRNETKLKRKSLSLRNHSGIFPVDEESVYQRPAEELFFPPPFTNTIPSVIYPPAKVKPQFANQNDQKMASTHFYKSISESELEFLD